MDRKECQSNLTDSSSSNNNNENNKSENTNAHFKDDFFPRKVEANINFHELSNETNFDAKKKVKIQFIPTHQQIMEKVRFNVDVKTTKCQVSYINASQRIFICW